MIAPETSGRNLADYPRDLAPKRTFRLWTRNYACIYVHKKNVQGLTPIVTHDVIGFIEIISFMTKLIEIN